MTLNVSNIETVGFTHSLKSCGMMRPTIGIGKYESARTPLGSFSSSGILTNDTTCNTSRAYDYGPSVVMTQTLEQYALLRLDNCYVSFHLDELKNTFYDGSNSTSHLIQLESTLDHFLLCSTLLRENGNEKYKN